MPSIARTKRAVWVATPLSRWSRFSAVRSPASSARASPSTREHRAVLAPYALRRQALDVRLPVQRAEHVLGGVKPEDHARILLADRRPSPCALRHRRKAGQVAPAHILRKRPRDHVFQLAPHRVIHPAAEYGPADRRAVDQPVLGPCPRSSPASEETPSYTRRRPRRTRSRSSPARCCAAAPSRLRRSAGTGTGSMCGAVPLA